MSQLDYSLIGNCQISALLDNKARYVWSCMPRLDSQAIFASLLGNEDNGIWSCLPEDPSYQTRQSYLHNTNIIKTEFSLQSGERFEIVDFAPRFRHRDGYFRPVQLIRIIRKVAGNPRVRMVLKPRFDYGRVTPSVSVSSEGIAFNNQSERLYFSTNIPTSYVADGQVFELTGDYYGVLSYNEPFERSLRFGCEEYLERTIQYWRTWVKHCNIPCEYQEAVIRSALALKLHIFEDTGAIIAATTTSIPESGDGGRTWDYRYCWLRDAYFVIQVLNQLGHFEEMEKFVAYLHNIAVSEPSGELQPVYGIGGERELTEHKLPWLSGFRGMGPVRIGNAAYAHPQHDAYGEMVLAVAPIFLDSRLDRIDPRRAFNHMVTLVEHAIVTFDRPDAGIWEHRLHRDHYVFSKLMCWVAVDRGLKIATRLGKADQYSNWFHEAKRMRDIIEREAWNEELGFFTQTLNGKNPDAANLLMAAVNFSRWDSPNFRQMVNKYEALLMKSGFVFRYRNKDDLGVPLNAFTICTFWMVDALWGMGRKEEARKIFETTLMRANHVGLLSEDVDPETGELWGNFPQAYSHVGVINSAFRLSKPWEEAL
ncbi:MAG: glycoside hydrolase family 15 protein [Deltaproteobacteria bacterium]|nr:glycoside hydrolase family 15 protein [Deltaproteobacteria bacterium]